jgi:sulfur carrier protein
MKFILPDKGTTIIDHSPGPIDRILLEMGINPLEVIVSRDGKMIPDDTIVGPEDEIRVIRIAHGG